MTVLVVSRVKMVAKLQRTGLSGLLPSAISTLTDKRIFGAVALIIEHCSCIIVLAFIVVPDLTL